MKVNYAENPDLLIREVVQRVEAADLDFDGSNKPWTRQITQIFKGLFQSETDACDVLYSCAEEKIQEFLLDVVVWDRESGEGVSLAVETEWLATSKDIEEDFWKLMVVKSPLKLMIFALSGRARMNTQTAVWERLQNCLIKYRDHRENEKYAFIDFAKPPHRMAWWIEIPQNGKLEKVPQPKYVQL